MYSALGAQRSRPLLFLLPACAASPMYLRDINLGADVGVNVGVNAGTHAGTNVGVSVGVNFACMLANVITGWCV